MAGENAVKILKNVSARQKGVHILEELVTLKHNDAENPFSKRGPLLVFNVIMATSGKIEELERGLLPLELKANCALAWKKLRKIRIEQFLNWIFTHVRTRRAKKLELYL